MQFTKEFFALAVALTLVGAGCKSVPVVPKTPPPSAASSTFTMADVGAHAIATSCYTAINGDVYDVTSWIDQHPGGSQAIIGMCGIDSSAAFDGQHGGQRRPASELAGFQIGKLVQ